MGYQRVDNDATRARDTAVAADCGVALVSRREPVAKTIFLLFGLFASGGFFVTEATAGDALPTDSEIRKAWIERAESVRAFRFTVQEDQFLARGVLPFGEGSASTKSPTPPRDVTLSAKFTLLSQGNDGRFSESRSTWSKESQQAVTQTFVATASGGIEMILFSEGQVPFPNGEITKGEALEYIFNYQPALPIALCYRITSPEFKAFAVQGKMAIEEIPHQEERIVMVTFPHGNGTAHLWLARDRGFIPLRYFTVNANGLTTVHLEIDYSRSNSSDGWAPSHWSSTEVFSSDGVSATSRKAHVVDFQINPEIAADQFTLTFPPGAWVNDMISKQRYIVRADGGKRVTTSEETPEDYPRIVSESSGSGLLSGRTILLFINTAIVCVLAWVLLSRRSVSRHEA
jgi:hypothetical protein